MIIHNIYVINVDGICPLSIKISSIETDPELVAGLFTASQKLWEHITGEVPKYISFKDMNAYIKPFSTGKKNWYLVLITEAEKLEVVEKVEDTILKIVEENKERFEKFYVNTIDTNKIVGDLIIDELAQIPCPHMSKKLLKHVCEIDGEQVEGLNCNLVSMAMCKTKIRDYYKKNY
jgi:hypothetical protein